MAQDLAQSECLSIRWMDGWMAEKGGWVGDGWIAQQVGGWRHACMGVCVDE